MLDAETRRKVVVHLVQYFGPKCKELCEDASTPTHLRDLLHDDRVGVEEVKKNFDLIWELVNLNDDAVLADVSGMEGIFFELEESFATKALRYPLSRVEFKRDAWKWARKQGDRARMLYCHFLKLESRSEGTNVGALFRLKSHWRHREAVNKVQGTGSSAPGTQRHSDSQASQASTACADAGSTPATPAAVCSAPGTPSIQPQSSMQRLPSLERTPGTPLLRRQSSLQGFPPHVPTRPKAPEKRDEFMDLSLSPCNLKMQQESPLKPADHEDGAMLRGKKKQSLAGMAAPVMAAPVLPAGQSAADLTLNKKGQMMAAPAAVTLERSALQDSVMLEAACTSPVEHVAHKSSISMKKCGVAKKPAAAKKRPAASQQPDEHAKRSKKDHDDDLESHSVASASGGASHDDAGSADTGSADIKDTPEPADEQKHGGKATPKAADGNKHGGKATPKAADGKTHRGKATPKAADGKTHGGKATPKAAKEVRKKPAAGNSVVPDDVANLDVKVYEELLEKVGSVCIDDVRTGDDLFESRIVRTVQRETVHYQVKCAHSNAYILPRYG